MKNIQFSARFIWALLAFLAPVAVCAQPGNYNTYNQPAWNVQGNSIIGSQWLGTRNSRSLTIKTNNTLAAKIDSLQRLYLYQVYNDSTPDSVLTIRPDGEVMKAPYIAPIPPTAMRGAQNGLNTTYDSTELGGSLIRYTQVNTENYNLTIFSDKAKASGSPAFGTNFGVSAEINSLQNSVLYNMNNKLVMAKNMDHTQSKAYPVFNFYNELELPRASWQDGTSIINFHSAITRPVTGFSPYSYNSTVHNVINNLTATVYDAYTTYPQVPMINRYVNLWLGYRLPYIQPDAIQQNQRFKRRFELLINSAADTSTIWTYADILLTTNCYATIDTTTPTTTVTPGLWGIYQQHEKANYFKGTFDFDNTSQIRLPRGTTAQRPVSPLAAQFRYNTTDSIAEIYNGSAWQKILQFTQQPAIPNPAGGSVVDVEARAAIVSILQTLRTLGIIAP